MKEREQKIFGTPETCPQKNRTESNGYAGGQTFMWITENNLTDNNPVGYGLLEFILSPSNLSAAYLQVRRNKGAGVAFPSLHKKSPHEFFVRAGRM